jgi:glutaredoxin
MGKSIVSLVSGLGLTLAVSVGVWTIAFSSSAIAQYKWQGADGKINYSDIPPPAEGKLLRGPNGVPPVEVAEGSPNDLPYALKQAVNKYPVTLYAAPDCAPCKQARDALTKRGIPFAEKSIVNSNDVEYFKKLGFTEATIPSVMVGKEKSVGFEASAYDRLLDAAGYPRSSLLPKTYKGSAAEVLTKSSNQIKLAAADEAKAEKTENAKEGKAEPTKRQLEQARRQEEMKKQASNPTNVQF